MVKVSETEYDGGNAGNGNRTKLTQPVDGTSGNDRVTKFKYDWRDRLVFVVDAEEFSSKVTYSRSDLDNMGRAKKTERYYDADDDESFPDDGTVDGGDRLLARSEVAVRQAGTRLPREDLCRGSGRRHGGQRAGLGHVVRRGGPSDQAASGRLGAVHQDGLRRTGPGEQDLRRLRRRRVGLRGRRRRDRRHDLRAKRERLRRVGQRDPGDQLRPQAHAAATPVR